MGTRNTILKSHKGGQEKDLGLFSKCPEVLLRRCEKVYSQQCRNHSNARWQCERRWGDFCNQGNWENNRLTSYPRSQEVTQRSHLEADQKKDWAWGTDIMQQTSIYNCVLTSQLVPEANSQKLVLRHPRWRQVVVRRCLTGSLTRYLLCTIQEA